MKSKTVLLVILLLLVSQAIFSSVTASVGIKTGINFATVNVTSRYGLLSTIKYKSGLIVGGFMKYKLGQMFAIQSEVYFTNKGMKSYYDEEEEEGCLIKTKTTWELDYIELPILLTFNIPVRNSFKPFYFFGPALSFNLSAKEEYHSTEYEYEGGDVIDSFYEVNDISSDIHNTDFGLIIGIGFNKNKFIFDMRYDIGLYNMFINTGDNFSAKNRALSILIGYEFQ